MYQDKHKKKKRKKENQLSVEDDVSKKEIEINTDLHENVLNNIKITSKPEAVDLQQLKSEETVVNGEVQIDTSQTKKKRKRNKKKSAEGDTEIGGFTVLGDVQTVKVQKVC